MQNAQNWAGLHSSFCIFHSGLPLLHHPVSGRQSSGHRWTSSEPIRAPVATALIAHRASSRPRWMNDDARRRSVRPNLEIEPLPPLELLRVLPPHDHLERVGARRACPCRARACPQSGSRAPCRRGAAPSSQARTGSGRRRLPSRRSAVAICEPRWRPPASGRRRFRTRTRRRCPDRAPAPGARAAPPRRAPRARRPGPCPRPTPHRPPRGP